ncbi:unnamed protein product, partial [Ectocarpus sp. 12 AP-2014]
AYAGCGVSRREARGGGTGSSNEGEKKALERCVWERVLSTKGPAVVAVADILPPLRKTPTDRLRRPNPNPQRQALFPKKRRRRWSKPGGEIVVGTNVRRSPPGGGGGVAGLRGPRSRRDAGRGGTGRARTHRDDERAPGPRGD